MTTTNTTYDNFADRVGVYSGSSLRTLDLTLVGDNKLKVGDTIHMKDNVRPSLVGDTSATFRVVDVFTHKSVDYVTTRNVTKGGSLGKKKRHFLRTVGKDIYGNHTYLFSGDYKV
jgi:hypothetical protein